jgi:hypothetical protein
MTKIDELETLLAKAWRGPLRADVSPPGPCGQVCRNEAVVRDVEGVPGIKHVACRGMQSARQWYYDANLMAAAVNNLAKLIAVAREVEAMHQRFNKSDCTFELACHAAMKALAALEEP